MSEYIDSFNKEKYEQLAIRLPKGCRDVIHEQAKQRNMSTAAYIWYLVENDREELKRLGVDTDSL
jgi:hypothetical protein